MGGGTAASSLAAVGDGDVEGGTAGGAAEAGGTEGIPKVFANTGGSEVRVVGPWWYLVVGDLCFTRRVFVVEWERVVAFVQGGSGGFLLVHLLFDS